MYACMCVKKNIINIHIANITSTYPIFYLPSKLLRISHFFF